LGSWQDVSYACCVGSPMGHYTEAVRVIGNEELVKRSAENGKRPRKASPPVRRPVRQPVRQEPPPEGSDPPVNRPILTAPQMLDARVRAQFTLSWGRARAVIEQGKIFVDGQAATQTTSWARPESVVELKMTAPKPRPARLASDSIVHLDAHVVVVRKPAGLSTVPYGEEEADNLERRVREQLTRQSSRGGVAPLGVVHRIDKETSGILVFTRTWLAKQSLSAQFRAHTVHRRYLAIAHGVVGKQTFRTHLVENRGDGLRGSSKGVRPQPGAQLAITHVEPVEALDGATLVACTLETGRTHQIRIHLAESGHPIVGDRVYIRGYRGGDEIRAPRLMLHAAELGFIHPATEQEVRFVEQPPEDFRETLDRLKI